MTETTGRVVGERRLALLNTDNAIVHGGKLAVLLRKPFAKQDLAKALQDANRGE